MPNCTPASVKVGSDAFLSAWREQDVALGEAAQPRLLDVVFQIDVEQAGAQHPHDGRREREPERERR